MAVWSFIMGHHGREMEVSCVENQMIGSSSYRLLIILHSYFLSWKSLSSTSHQFSHNTAHIHTLQKQVGCFNHKVVSYHSCRQAEETVVMRGLLMQLVSNTAVLEINCIRQPNRQLPSSSYNHSTLTTLTTSVKESLQMHFQVAVKNYIVLSPDPPSTLQGERGVWWI